MSNRVEKFNLYLNTPAFGVIKVAKTALRESNGILDLLAIRYDNDYLNTKGAFALDPVRLPLRSADYQLECRGGGVPGILDDYLPDAWGRQVLSQLAFYRDGERAKPQSPIDMLALVNESSRIGALQWVPEGKTPDYRLGAPIDKIKAAESVAHLIESEHFDKEAVDQFNLTYLANAGTGVGGARPKALIAGEDGSAYLAKFNSITNDRYNNARVELACLEMARAAGIRIGHGKVSSGINGRDALLLNRFDVVPGGRQHLITINALIKTEGSEVDRGGAFRYDDIAAIIKKWSTEPEEDLDQLLRQMLFNAAINNTDDHERNFSLMNNGDGWRLSPAYDMVPSLSVGQYHVAGYQYSPYPIMPSEAQGRVFGLSASKVKKAADGVIAAIDKWSGFCELAGVNEKDHDAIKAVIRS